jgi:hypothetical protein
VKNTQQYVRSMVMVVAGRRVVIASIMAALPATTQPGVLARQASSPGREISCSGSHIGPLGSRSCLNAGDGIPRRGLRSCSCTADHLHSLLVAVSERQEQAGRCACDDPPMPKRANQRQLLRHTHRVAQHKDAAIESAASAHRRRRIDC